MDNKKSVNGKNKKQKNASPSRKLVLELLTEWEKEGGRFDLMLKGVLDKYDYLDKRDKAFISVLSKGCVERRITLDYVIDRYSDTNGKAMKLPVRLILRMAVYQLLFMEGIKDHAACNEAVLLANEKGLKTLAPFVNGVLRSIERDKENIKWPDKKDDDKSLKIFYSVYYSMPIWIVGIFMKQFGPSDTEKILKSFLSQGGVSLRINNLRDKDNVIKELESLGIKYSFSDYLPFMVTIDGFAGIGSLKCFNEGKVTVQDISSALCSELAGIKEGDNVLDMCGAPGGKTTHAALKTGKSGHVTSCDITEEKTYLINENISRMGIANTDVLVNDGTVFNPAFEEAFNVVICDAPCSGLGIMGRKPDIRYNMTYETTEELANLQKKILENAVRYVKKGGTLIFSTCTLNDKENMGGRDFILSKEGMTPDSLDNIPEQLKNEPGISGGYICLKPGIHKCDGFFISKYRKS